MREPDAWTDENFENIYVDEDMAKDCGGIVPLFKIQSEMTLRDRFAIAILPALFAARGDAYAIWSEHLASEAYRIAEVMMKTREEL